MAIWQEKLANISGFKKKYQHFWLLLGLLTFLIQFLTILITKGVMNGLFAFGIYCIIISYSGILSIFASKRFTKIFSNFKTFSFTDTQINEIQTQTLNKIFNIKQDLKFFSTVGLAYFITLLLITNFFSNQEPWFGNNYANIFATISWFLWCFITIPQISLIWQILNLSRNLNDFNLKTSFYIYPLNGLKDLGQLFFIISLNHSIILGLIYFGIYFSPVPLDWPAIFWMGVGGILVFLSFIIPQINLHRLIINEKTSQIKKLLKKNDVVFCEIDVSPTLENLQRLDCLYSLELKMKNLQEWSFDAKALLLVLSSLILPLFIFILDKLLLSLK